MCVCVLLFLCSSFMRRMKITQWEEESEEKKKDMIFSPCPICAKLPTVIFSFLFHIFFIC
ncbi:hypothetical protein Scep_016278 [Stephania cephalantha]|uniref:Uncharacterized protein n=1 Tax=Stephania cephalantha TaxID=152367 RepID=A0AAP0IN67_9MAGN